MTQIAIWSMIQAALRNESGNDSDSEKSTREIISEIIFGEVLFETGDIESELTYTGIRTFSGFPDAFVFDEDAKTLRLCLLVGRLGPVSMPNVSPADLLKARHELISHLGQIARGEESFNEQNVEGLGQFIYEFSEVWRNLTRIEIKIVILGRLKNFEDKLDEEIFEISGHKNIYIDTHVFDIPQLQTQQDLTHKSGTVNLDLLEFLGGPLRCLEVSSGGSEVKTYLAIFPGEALAEIYGRYRTRVLQKNLRNYLQATGKVNKGILKTLQEMPGRFLAYNNGLTITASSVQLNGAGNIVSLEDFQIVNGGQTTASLDHAKRYLGLSLEKVSIQAKINVIDVRNHPTFIDDISNFANSQNKVKVSDFASRDSFQERLSELMRDNDELLCEWSNGDKNYWYYEAFRGGYPAEKYSRAGQAQRQFEFIFPRNQVIDKIELAKVENAWDGYPHFVCRGADMNFAEWVKRTKPHFRSQPTVEYCRDLIAKVILFRAFSEIVKSQGYPAFRSQILAISYSYFRYLLEKSGEEIDLSKIWDLGTISEDLSEIILELIVWSQRVLTTASGGFDPAQWAKTAIAWEKIKSVMSPTPPKIRSKLRNLDLLRSLSFNFDVACAKAIDAIEKSSEGLVKREILSEININDIYWEDVRRSLLKDYDVVLIKSGGLSRYRKSAT